MSSARTPDVTPAAARAGGLVYVSADMPGVRRFRWGQTFRYRTAQGAWVRNPDEIARIRRLAIPPAYSDVWICPLHNGHLQATGIDARGRKQYRYHPEWRALKDGTKFDRLEAFGRALPGIRRRVARDLREGGVARNALLAALVRLLDVTFLRVGNEEYARSNGSYGLTTLRNRHADVRGDSLVLRFRGKGGVVHQARVDDPRVARIVRRCQQLPGQELFQYEDAEGLPRAVSSTDVNDYLREISGQDFTAKDFRTWHGTVLALESLRLACEGGAEAAGPRTTAILEAVAQRLGNTPAVCRKAYVHPAVLALAASWSAPQGGQESFWTEIAARVRPSRGLRAAEQRLLVFLRRQRPATRRRVSAGRQRPERRSRR